MARANTRDQTPEVSALTSPDEFFDWRTFDPEQLPGGRDSPLAVELVTYRDRRPEMPTHHAGRFVLIQKARLVGYHESREAALKAAFGDFGREPVLMKQVVARETIRRPGSAVS